MAPVVLFFTVGRSLMCWFYKINTIVKSLDDIVQKLNSINGNLSVARKTEVSLSKNVSNDTVEEKTNSAEPIKVPKGKWCPKCGARNSAAKVFCVNCGTSL